MMIKDNLLNKQTKLAVVGMGYVGMPLAVAFSCIFREICASVPLERSAVPLQTERSSA